MKILNICAYTWSIGGPARMIYDYTKVAVELGHEVTILSPASPEDQIYTTAEGVKVLVFYRTQPISRFFNEFSWEMYRYLKAHIHEYDVVHCHGIFHFGSVAPFLFKNNVPKAITIHGLLDRWAIRHSYWKKKVFSTLLQKRFLANADLIHVLNEDERQDVKNYLGFEHKNVQKIPNGMDLADFGKMPPKGDFRRKYGIYSNTKMVLFLSRINIKKGLDLLLPAFKKYCKDYDDAILILAGPDDGYLVETQRFIRENNLEKKIKLVGMLTGEEKKQALADATIFTLPSYSEGFSIAALEAMTAGLPCLVSSRIGFDGSVKEYEAGLEVELNENAVFEGLASLLQNDSLQKIVAQNGQRMVNKLYDINIVAANLVSALKNITSPKS